jgi:glutamine amidotransferase-like uncharacterized protein
VLLFIGTGTSPNDVAAIRVILDRNHLRYATVTSSQLNAMDTARLMEHHLLIVPGGDFLAMGSSLTPATMTRVRDAVQGGLNYLGICAGGFLAGQASYRSFGLAPVQFSFYAAADSGVRKASVPIAGAGSATLEHYWEDGPQFSGWGAVVGKYPDGTPAIVEGSSGKGWVMLAGVHAEAPEAWRQGMSFAGSASAANAYAGTLIEAALNGTGLPHY